MRCTSWRGVVGMWLVGALLPFGLQSVGWLPDLRAIRTTESEQLRGIVLDTPAGLPLLLADGSAILVIARWDDDTATASWQVQEVDCGVIGRGGDRCAAEAIARLSAARDPAAAVNIAITAHDQVPLEFVLQLVAELRRTGHTRTRATWNVANGRVGDRGRTLRRRLPAVPHCPALDGARTSAAAVRFDPARFDWELHAAGGVSRFPELSEAVYWAAQWGTDHALQLRLPANAGWGRALNAMSAAETAGFRSVAFVTARPGR